MLKRGVVNLETQSPETHALKRRRFVDPSVTHTPQYLLNSNVPSNPGNLLFKRRCSREAEMVTNFFGRGVEEANEQDACLRGELNEVKSLAAKKVEQLELVGRNLQRACEEQAMELRRVHQENKLLKRSLLTLNGKRSEVEKELTLARDMINNLGKRCSELERANVTLCMRGHSSNGALCRQDERGDGSSGGGGHIF
jgi:hypothetical protein